MKCSFCDKDDGTVERVFMDSGCQVGMNYICATCRKTKYKEYLNSTGFEEIGTSDDMINSLENPSTVLLVEYQSGL